MERHFNDTKLVHQSYSMQLSVSVFAASDRTLLYPPRASAALPGTASRSRRPQLAVK